MKQIESTASAQAHRRAARFHVRACKRYPDTKPLAEATTPLMKKVKETDREWDDAEEDEMDSLADVLLADNETDDLLRDLHGAAEKADRADPKLAITKALFPDGLGEEVAPRGAKEAKPLARVKGRLAEKKWEHSLVAKEFLPKLDAASKTLDDAAKAHESAKKATDVAHAKADAAKTALREQLTSDHGKLIDLYKANPKRAERFFYHPETKAKKPPGTA
ncbi:hypothetical protein HY251_00095 [bacterium]|nr:hypothetical protein [bacterium]